MLAKKLTMRKRHGGRAALTTSKSLFKAFFFSFLFLTVSVAWAQPNLTCDGNVQTVGFTGTYQDFIVPDDPSVGQIEITLKGGSWVSTPEYCRSAFRNRIPKDPQENFVGYRVAIRKAMDR